VCPLAPYVKRDALLGKVRYPRRALVKAWEFHKPTYRRTQTLSYKDKPKAHGDLLYVFQDVQGSPLKTIYFDNEARGATVYVCPTGGQETASHSSGHSRKIF
jgi:hypothetical protein